MVSDCSIIIPVRFKYIKLADYLSPSTRDMFVLSIKTRDIHLFRLAFSGVSSGIFGTPAVLPTTKCAFFGFVVAVQASWGSLEPKFVSLCNRCINHSCKAWFLWNQSWYLLSCSNVGWANEVSDIPLLSDSQKNFVGECEVDVCVCDRGSGQTLGLILTNFHTHFGKRKISVELGNRQNFLKVLKLYQTKAGKILH